MNGKERRRLPVDLEELSGAFENGFPDLSYYLDIETSAVAMVGDETHDAYRDMEDFVATVMDERLRERLADTIDGRRAFSRFKRVQSAYVEERERWFAFRDARLRDRIVAWLDAEGIEPIIEGVSILPPPDVAASSTSYVTLHK